jgi:hypothetical protein
MRTIDEVLNRLRAEFVEMPGLQLTVAQAQRLCGVERTLCQMVLDALVDEEVLCVSVDGRYKRWRQGEALRSRGAKASLRTDQRAKWAS